MLVRARLRKPLSLLIAALGAFAMLALGVPAAQAAPAALLPPIGSEISCSMLSPDTPVTIQGHRYVVDFRGGIRFRVDVDRDDPINSVRLRVVGFG